MNLISRLINKSGLRISHSKVFSSELSKNWHFLIGREKGWLKPTLVRSVNGKNPGFALQNYHLFFINYRPYFTSEHLILVNKYVSGAPMKG